MPVIDTDLMWSALEASNGNSADISMAIDLLLEKSGGVETALIRTLRWMMQNDRWPIREVRDGFWWWGHTHSPYFSKYTKNSGKEFLEKKVFDALNEYGKGAYWCFSHTLEEAIKRLPIRFIMESE